MSIDILQIAKEIVWAAKNAKPHKWKTWDSWSGQQEDHEQSREDAEVKAVMDYLAKVWPKDATGMPIPKSEPSTTIGAIR